MKFALSKEDHGRIQEWLKNVVYPEIIAKQRAAAEAAGRHDPVSEACWDAGGPYGGAIGGGLTYLFTPTTLGTVVKVQHGDDRV